MTPAFFPPIVKTAPYIVLLLVGCASLSGVPPLPPDWTRETFDMAPERCSSARCAETIARNVGGYEVRTRMQYFAPHQIPGWEAGVVGRILGSIVQDAIRGRGGMSDRVRIGLGTRTVAAPDSAGPQLRCSLLFIEDQTITREAGEDAVTDSQRRTEGIHCATISLTDSAVWRLRSGIAPPRDSLAAIYDSLVAAKSALVEARPPMLIERVGARGSVGEQIAVIADTSQSRFQRMLSSSSIFTRADGSPIARITPGLETIYDFAPTATEVEKNLVRLFGAAVVVRWR
jgi:hypothetical protein